MSIQGTVKTWNVAKGYGFLRSAFDGSEAFAHHSNLPGPGLIVGKTVFYNVESAQPLKRGNHLVAIDIHGEGVLPPVNGMGQMRGRVKLWVNGRSMGVITSIEGEEIHVHSSAFGGGSLAVGKDVTFDLTREVHNKTGKRIAFNVQGEGVVTIGKQSGKVKAWIGAKGYGFVEMDDGTEVYVHRSALSNGHCLAGKVVYFDFEPQNHESGRKLAKNVTGPGVRPGSAITTGKGGKGVKGMRKGIKGGKGRFTPVKGFRGAIGGKGMKGGKGSKSRPM
eukprot:TRINITY_DN8047_c0_g1_i1.p1 TRINITY_DN8047_c0_g1~~TRINITY_DN8047_c0_g1_i1.p1  ORF type:complete len:300 (+),score=114.30 TRINITY_DN8047_c0_g1_i1:70-900(+)